MRKMFIKKPGGRYGKNFIPVGEKICFFWNLFEYYLSS